MATKKLDRKVFTGTTVGNQQIVIGQSDVLETSSSLTALVDIQGLDQSFQITSTLIRGQAIRDTGSTASFQGSVTNIVTFAFGSADIATTASANLAVAEGSTRMDVIVNGVAGNTIHWFVEAHFNHYKF